MDIHQFEIHFKQLASAYLQHLEQAELTALLQLFSPKAEVLYLPKKNKDPFLLKKGFFFQSFKWPGFLG